MLEFFLAAVLTHPLQPALECRVDSHDYVRAMLYVKENGSERQLATFGSMDPAGACELAIRNARNGIVCAPSNYTVRSVNIANGEVVASFDSENAANYRRCFAAVNVERPATRPGFVEFIAPERLAPFKSHLPRIENTEVQAVLNDPATMWYDELSMIFTYQDSQGSPMGLRANRVGWDVGSNTEDVPDIHKLVEYFEPGHFRAPFKTAAGTSLVPPSEHYLLNFWRLPQENGQVIPVRYWREGSRWRWTFPIGTFFGEILYMRAPDDGTWHVYEIRTRKRYSSGWAVDAFRPFTRSEMLADAIKQARPTWATTSDLSSLVRHLERPNTLTPATLTSTSVYDAIMPPVHGALDFLPETRDYALIKELLATTPFRSAEGTVWKADGALETYAPSTKAPFSIVPTDYELGLIPVNETSCNRCHDQTGRELGDLDDRIVLYGEMWGEDRIFTWHLFDATFDSFTVSDGSRRINPRFTQARIVSEGQPAASDARYGTPLGPVR